MTYPVVEPAMTHATVVYPHQLFAESPALVAAKKGPWPVYLVEESLLLTFNPIHRQKLIFHKLSLDAYQQRLEQAGFQVIRLCCDACPNTPAVFARLKRDDVRVVHIVDTTDDYLEKAIAASGLTRVWYDSPLFILPKKEACRRFIGSKRFLARFYKQLRQDKRILLDDTGGPVGGQWSFDEQNRKKLPRKIQLPDDISMQHGARLDEAEVWAQKRVADGADVYGHSGTWLPFRHDDARTFLDTFLRERFSQFGPFEDAMSMRGTRLFHSTLSPLLNVGLLSPEQVINSALDFANAHAVPIASLEGFIRQILGWREFVRASYEVDGMAMRNQNFWRHERPMPESVWQAKTGIDPLDHVIHSAQKFAYTHHIERLMVLGNFMLLCHIHPHDVYRWFMAMYADAYDWVMVPNVYGMSQFADGGSFATKPYISGANYIKKMSDFKKGEWEDTWTALYWNFISEHASVFAANHRLSMMPKLLENMPAETRQGHLERARHFLASLESK